MTSNRRSAIFTLFLGVFALGSAVASAAENPRYSWKWDLPGDSPHHLGCWAGIDGNTGINNGREVYRCSVMPVTNNALYPPIRKNVEVNGVPNMKWHDVVGCYNWDFQRVYEITGDPRTARCMTPEAPIRFYLTYATTCPDTPTTQTQCTYGVEFLVYPRMTIDGPNPYGDAFRPIIGMDLPIRIVSGQVGTNAEDICIMMNKSDTNIEGLNPVRDCDDPKNKYCYDPVLQSCRKTPKTYCEEMGFFWSKDDEMCISEKNPLCDASKCTNNANYCVGHTYRPAGETCTCIGENPVIDQSVKGACSWVHTEDLANPYCDETMDQTLYKWVANASDPDAEFCCEVGDTACGNPAANGSIPPRTMYKEDAKSRAPAGVPIP